MIQKQSLNINFAQGLDTKTDPWQISPGNFLALQNSVFTTGGRVTKRNGYALLPAQPSAGSTYLTTFNNNLTAIGDSISAYNEDSQAWVSRGTIQPLQLNTIPLIRNNINQIQVDTALSSNGLVCTVYSENNGSATDYKYAIADSKTGQNIIAPVLIPVTSGTVTGSPRVFVLGNFFVVVFTNVISSTSHLQYIAISIINPSSVTANQDIASNYVSSTTLSWDGVVVNNALYIAYDTTSGGQAINYTSLTATQAAAGDTPATAQSLVGYKATLISMCADTTTKSATIYIVIYRSDYSNTFVFAINTSLFLTMIPIRCADPVSIPNIACAAQNGTCSVFFEVPNTYGYDSGIPTNYIKGFTITPLGAPVTFTSHFGGTEMTITASSATGLVNGMYIIDVTTINNLQNPTTFTISGTTLTLSNDTQGNSASPPGDTLMAQAITISSETTIIRSVGLASKAFIVDGTVYFLSAYSSNYQPTYFLINGSLSLQTAPVIVAKLAYENGGGYLTLGLPSVTVLNSNQAYVAYLYKDLIAAVNKSTTANPIAGTQTAGVYSQTGINLASFTIGTSGLDTAEIGSDLHISGGFLGMYDGYLPVEHNFFVWPDSIEATWTANSTNTGTWSSGATTITVGSTTGLAIGMTITDTSNPTYIPAGTTVVNFVGTLVAISQATTHAASGDTIALSGTLPAQPDGMTNTDAYYYQVTYEWTDNQGNAFRSAPSIPVPVTTTGSSDGIITVNIPTLRLTAKTANPVKLVVYRWSVAQQVYYQTTSISSPVLNKTNIDSINYVDQNPDTTIVGNNIIYTNGGVVEDINGPASNIMTLFDTRLWLVDSEDQNLLWFSKQVIESTPVEMSDLFTYYVPPTTAAQGSTGPITALAPLDDKLIVFKANAIYYINGSGPDNTGANNQYSPPIFITSTVGCANQQSIVFMPQGLMFQSNKGIWLLGRDLATTYIGAGVEQYNSSVVQSAVNVPQTNQVRFTLNTGQTLMYDYYYNQWGTFTGVPAISSCIYNGLHTFLNSYGSVYQESPGTYVDGSNPVLIGFTSAWFNLTGLQGYQRAYFFYLLGNYLSPHKLQLGIAYDYNPAPSQSSLISPINYGGVYGGPTPGPTDGTDYASPLGQQTPLGGGAYGLGSVERWRVFLTRQRCQAFQITLQEVYDSSFGVAPGAGLTLSGINLVYGKSSTFRPTSVSQSVGGGTAIR